MLYCAYFQNINKRKLIWPSGSHIALGVGEGGMMPLCSHDMYLGIGLYEGHAFEQCSILGTNYMPGFLRLPCASRDVIPVSCAYLYACVMSRGNSVNILIRYGVNDSTRPDMLNELKNVYIYGR